MSPSQPPEKDHPVPRLYLVTPAIEDADAFAATLAAALRAADVAAVLLRLQRADERTLINRVKTIAAVVQDTGAALVLEGHPEIVARAGADGAHITGIDAFLAALEPLKPARIAGCGGLHTRHDAMVAAENAADYVMFGEPEGDGRPAFEAIIERIEWWAEVFEVPCVGFAARIDEIAPIVAAGADFVALGEFIWNDSRGPAAALADVAARFASPEAVA
jgi:thiamine-phosphate pyrophosphorylase